MEFVCNPMHHPRHPAVQVDQSVFIVPSSRNIKVACLPTNLSVPSACRTQRYYPTNTALADGRVLVMGGASESEGCQLRGYEGANTPMIFDATKPTGQQWKSLTDGRGPPGELRGLRQP